MPRGTYNRKLSHEEVLELVDSGAYRVDLTTGGVFSGRTGKPLFSFSFAEPESGYTNKRSDYLWVRLYKSPSFILIPVAHVVWIVGTRSSIPKGWEIHHDDGNRKNNAFTNLFCYHPVDHRKRHGRYKPKPDEVPF